MITAFNSTYNSFLPLVIIIMLVIIIVNISKIINSKKCKHSKSYIIAHIIITVISFIIFGISAIRVVSDIIQAEHIKESIEAEEGCQSQLSSDQLHVMDKPVIYLYSNSGNTISANVVLGKPNLLTCSYPKYTTGWNVKVSKTGDLVDLDTGKNLYSLYYESRAGYNFIRTHEGFCVSANELPEFFEDKLERLGLNSKEKEEFIIYWLPVLQQSKYTYIRFAKKYEIDKSMPLTITPTPDNEIRVLMTYEPLDSPVDVEEEELETPSRTGFTVVEWGGTEINSSSDQNIK